MQSDYFNYNTAKSYLDSSYLRNESIASTKNNLTSCLFECFCDILFSSEHNVSQSPGYEACTRQCGRGKN